MPKYHRIVCLSHLHNFLGHFVRDVEFFEVFKDPGTTTLFIHVEIFPLFGRIHWESFAQSISVETIKPCNPSTVHQNYLSCWGDDKDGATTLCRPCMVAQFSFLADLTRAEEVLLRLKDKLSWLSITTRILHLHAHNFSTQKTQGILLDLSLAKPAFTIVILFH